jgi:cytochrome c oxidase assembly protein subunit 15
MNKGRYSGKVLTWLVIGLVMVFIQIVVGGITRLTESGLSITKWEVVEGTVPPLNQEDWEHEFELYKQSPQYKLINEGMTMDDFKFIYFWEYIHRLWGRLMGFVFLIPFIYFLSRKMIDRNLMKRLSVVIVFALLAAIFGWIMVASGLVERPWVNAYKLSTHLIIALTVFSSLLWTILYAFNVTPLSIFIKQPFIKNSFIFLAVLLFFQITLGGILSGMRAATQYPTWPDMLGEYFPSVILDFANWSLVNFTQYDSNPFMPALIHFLHRNTAYMVLAVGIFLGFKLYNTANKQNSTQLQFGSLLLIGVLFLQVILGILTLLGSSGAVPVWLGVMHQAGAVLVTGTLLYLFFILRGVK